MIYIMNDNEHCIDNSIDISKNENCHSIIKHMILSGGGPSGLITYGALKYLNKNGFWNLENIETIYGCSIGGCFGFIISLGYEWDWLDDYFIKRPWNDVFKSNVNSIFESFYDKGFLDEKVVYDLMRPLLQGKDLELNITLKDLYEWNKKEIHVYTTNINTKRFEKVDISYKTHPTMSVIKAISMTCAYPVAFKPICMDGNCFIDGGLLNNYPLNDCIYQTKCNLEEILAFKNIFISNDTVITNESSMIDYMNVIIKKMQNEINTESKQQNIKNTVRCIVENLSSFTEWAKSIETEQSRINLIDKGIHDAKIFLSYIDYKN